MENEATAVSGYINRPAGHAPEHRVHLRTDRHHAGRRPSMRIARVALRAYEQRTERRARLRSWLVAQLAAAPAAR